MNLIAIETQKKRMYIPIVNIFNFWALYINLVRAKVSGAGVMKALLYLCGHMIPVWFVCTGLGRLIPGISLLAWLGTVYLVPIAMSFGSIKYQGKYLFE